MKKDITTRQDIEKLVDTFYSKVFDDALLSPVFSIVDWDHHKLIMYNFWSSMLLGDKTYTGNPFSKHINLPIQQQHFTQWLLLFEHTIDENFEGAKAEEAKSRARSIAGIFQHRLGLL